MSRYCGRTRKWATQSGIVEIPPDCNVLIRYLHGGDLALARVNGLRQGGPRKKSMPPRIRRLAPPPGGWTGGNA